MKHIIRPDHSVQTVGDAGQQIALTEPYLTAGDARLFATGMAQWIGGTVEDQTVPALVRWGVEVTAKYAVEHLPVPS